MSDFMQIEPQPARGKLLESMWDDPNYLAEEKFDGFRLIGQVCNGIVRFTTRRISVETGYYVERTPQIPHLSGYKIKNIPLAKGHVIAGPPRRLEGTRFDMEIVPANYYGMLLTDKGGISKHVGSIITSEPEEAIRKQQERGWLQAYVFDILHYRGEDLRGLPLEERKEWLHKALIEWGNPHVHEVNWADEFKRDFLRRVYGRGGEGLILKHKLHLYGNEKEWIKVKKCATYDVVIMGVEMAKEITKKKSGEVSRSRIAGKVGSIKIGQYKDGKLVPVGTARGFGDDLMHRLTLDPEKFYGRVITIEANGRERTGKFRHGRVTDPINPFRSDKRAKDCVFDLNEA